MKKTFLTLLCAGFLLSSCSGSDNSDDSSVNTDDTIETDDNSGGPTGDDGAGSDDGDGNDDGADALPDLEGVTGFNRSPEDLTEWELVFEDQFNEGLENWNVWDGGAFNNELQHYQQENLIIDDGYLFIKEKRESARGDTTPFDNTQKDFNFTSARIESQASYSAGNTEGATKLRFASRILLSEGDGLWPAFWSYGDPWPTQGEIDIMEFRGNDSSTYVTNFFFGTSANTPITDPAQTTFDVPVAGNITENWHVFEMIWSEETLEILLDGETVHIFTEEEWGLIDDIYTQSERLVLNMAVGGVFFNGQNLVEANIPDLAYTAVDWVRVYKQ